MIEKLPLELFIAVLVTKYVRFQHNISDKMKVLRSDRCTSETGNACSIAVCVSEPFFFVLGRYFLLYPRLTVISADSQRQEFVYSVWRLAVHVPAA